LVINTFFIFANKPLYVLYPNPKQHFAYNYEVAKELAEKLKAMDIHQIKTLDEELQIRLKFYGIQYGGDEALSSALYGTKASHTIQISYYGTIVARFYIYKE
jgi:hypothetical protein